jgi:3-methyladenine DNA glycosylase AlkC
LSGRLKDIFAFGKISNIISEVKEKRFMQKITETYSIESLSKSFTEKDVLELLAIYQKWSLDKQQTRL